MDFTATPTARSRLDRWKERASALRAETYALWLACRDPRVPWLPKLVAALVVAYAASPIDLIPDFVPVLGYADDLLLIPLGIALARRLIPSQILAEHRAEAARRFERGGPRSALGAALVLAVWLALAAWLASVAWDLVGAKPPPRVP